MAVVNQHYRLTFLGTDGISIFENVRWYRVIAVIGAGATDAQVAAAMNSKFTATYKALLPTTVSITGYSVQLCSSLGVPLSDQVTAVSGLPIAGTATGDPLPAFTAGVLSLRTGFSGRSFRGRFYTWPPAEGDNDTTGVPTAGWITRANTFGTLLTQDVIVISGGDETDLSPVIFSRKLTAGVVFRTSLTRSQWGTIRHRKIGRGR